MTLRSLVGAAFVAVTGAGTARAAAEGEWMAGVSAGVAGAEQGAGWAAALEAAHGLTDSWGLRAAAELALPAGERRVGLNAGVVFAWDVVRYVPFAELGASYAHDGAHALGPQAGLGVEYLLGPRWALGLVARAAYVVGGNSSWAVTGALRLARLF
jgi:hypothetical protein